MLTKILLYLQLGTGKSWYLFVSSTRKWKHDNFLCDVCAIMFFGNTLDRFRLIVSWWRSLPLTRPLRRLLLLIVFCLTIFLSSSLYNYIVNFFLPGFTIPVRQDLSKRPILKDQATFIRPVIQPRQTQDRLFLLVLTSSAANGEDHFQKRMAIRNTWGKRMETIKQWRIVFFLGKSFKPAVDYQRMKEAEKYGDLIIGDFPDTYRNITKKLVMAFNWASEQKYEYLLKTDDDVYINIPSLTLWIVRRQSPNMFLYAGVLYRAEVIRDVSHRHYVSWHDLPQKLYPWYPKGAMYVLSSEIVQEMVKIMSRVKQITVDDAYVGVLASYLGIQPIRLHGFIQWNFLPKLVEHFDKCTYMNIFGMADNLSAKDMYFIHDKVTLYRNSSKWMCIHVYHPVLFTGVMIILLLYLYIFIRKTNL